MRAVEPLSFFRAGKPAPGEKRRKIGAPLQKAARLRAHRRGRESPIRNGGFFLPSPAHERTQAMKIFIPGQKGKSLYIPPVVCYTVSRMYAGCSGGSVSFTRTAEYAPWGSLFPRSGFTEILKRGVKHAPRRKNRYYAGIRHP